jgi:branched-chain amino acid transport system substrate-binding protein
MLRAAESKVPYEYFKVLSTIPANEAFRPLTQERGVCPLVETG